MYEIPEMMRLMARLEDKQDMNQRTIMVKLEWGDKWLGNKADICYSRWGDAVSK